MGIDLKIIASHFRERRGEVLSTASIRVDRDPRLLSLFSVNAKPCIVETLPTGLKVGHFEDSGLQFDEKDRYGNPLTFTTPDRIRSVITEPLEINAWNQAALTFLLALPPETRIILYWC